jgi:hypothetical protein
MPNGTEIRLTKVKQDFSMQFLPPKKAEEEEDPMQWAKRNFAVTAVAKLVQDTVTSNSKRPSHVSIAAT